MIIDFHGIKCKYFVVENLFKAVNIQILARMTNNSN
jgi:hypothetical protein